MKRKIISNKMAFLDPKMVMTVVVALIVLSVGVFAYFTAVSSINQVPASTGSRIFADTDADAYDIQISGVSITSIEQGGTRSGPWSAYSGSYSYSGTTVTIG